MTGASHDPVQAAHHQIGNSLQAVAGMLMRQARGADPRVASALFDASRRIRVIIRLHERLQKQDTDTAVALDELLKDICSDITEIDALEEDRVLRLDLEAVQAPSSVASAVGLIAAELASNALEHGLGDHAGTCEVRLEATPRGCRLMVSDDGKGLADGEDVTAHEGFGLSMVRRLVAQILGTMTVIRLERGVRFQIDIPLPLSTEEPSPDELERSRSDFAELPPQASRTACGAPPTH